MLHTVYLASLCQRRRWPEPLYQTQYTPAGYRCVVRVNNREYQSSGEHSSETSAKEDAALIAFGICRSFSANDGMYPTGFAHGGVIQGNPVPVGSGRHVRRGNTDGRSDHRYSGDSDSAGSRSGGSSPDFGDHRRSISSHTSHTSRTYRSSHNTAAPPDLRYSRHGMPRY